MSKTIKVCDVVTVDGGVFVVVGDKATVREQTIHKASITHEYITLDVVGQANKIRTIDLLNRPRQLTVISDEREIELVEGQDPTVGQAQGQQGPSVAHVSLGK